jgi:hypothetical protein
VHRTRQARSRRGSRDHRRRARACTPLRMAGGPTSRRTQAARWGSPGNRSRTSMTVCDEVKVLAAGPGSSGDVHPPNLRQGNGREGTASPSAWQAEERVATTGEANPPATGSSECGECMCRGWRTSCGRRNVHASPCSKFLDDQVSAHMRRRL